MSSSAAAITGPIDRKQPLSARIGAGIGAASLLAGSALVATFDPTRANFFPVCPLFQLTGLACPGCGLTRGFHALFHGDVVLAADFNLLTPVWGIVFGYTWVSLLLLAIRGKGLPMWPTDPRFLWGFMIALLIFGVLRNLPVYPLTMLFP